MEGEEQKEEGKEESEKKEEEKEQTEEEKKENEEGKEEEKEEKSDPKVWWQFCMNIYLIIYLCSNVFVHAYVVGMIISFSYW